MQIALWKRAISRYTKQYNDETYKTGIACSGQRGNIQHDCHVDNVLVVADILLASSLPSELTRQMATILTKEGSDARTRRLPHCSYTHQALGHWHPERRFNMNLTYMNGFRG